jgi:hypothetical protein
MRDWEGNKAPSRINPTTLPVFVSFEGLPKKLPGIKKLLCPDKKPCERGALSQTSLERANFKAD